MGFYKYIKLFVFAALFVLNGLSLSNAQSQFGNGWIFADQKYYKIPVADTGIYAITFAQLDSVGIPVSAPQELQLFHRGIEQAIQISNDTLFFYGQRNDGTLDSLLYDPYSKQPHKYYNLYSDTTAYFLTWKAGSGSGKRMFVSNLTGTVNPDDYHVAEILSVYSNEYDMGYRYGSETFLSPGDQGEGWFGPAISATTSYTYTLFPYNVFSSGPSADFEIMLVGRNGDPFGLTHSIEILIGDPASPDSTFTVPAFSYHDVKVFKSTIPLSNLLGGSLKVTVRNLGVNFKPSLVSVAYIKVNYAQTCTIVNSKQFFKTLSNVGLSKIEFLNPPSDIAVYDLSDKDNISIIKGSMSGGKYKTILSASTSGHNLLVTSPSGYLAVSSIKKVDLSVPTNASSADYIIITNKKLITSAKEYASYRKSVAGGSYDTLLIDIDKLYNMYSYGEKSPISIRRFLAHLFNIGDPKYLFIIGKGLVIDYNYGYTYRTVPQNFINHPDLNYRREDLVPSFGLPCSDLTYSMGLNGNPKYVPAISTGRLAAKTDDEVRGYLKKMIEHDTTSKALWRKNLLHLSGGNSISERFLFYNYVLNLKTIVEDTLFFGKVVKTFSKKGNDAVDNELISSVAQEINKGVSYVTFFGHSSSGVTDLDIGYASNPLYGYDNKGKYPMLFINGCGAGQIFSRSSFNEDWVLTPDKGAILALAHVDAGFVYELHNYSTLFYKNSFQKRSLLGKSVADVQIGTGIDFDSLYKNSGATAIATMQQMALHGDPATSIYNISKPDYETNDSKVSIKALDSKLVTAVSDSFAISIIVANLGVDFGDSLKVSVKRTISGSGKVIDYGPVTYKHVGYEDTILFIIKSKDIATYGQNKFEIFLDPANQIDESDEMNNQATLKYFIPLSGIITLFPIEYSIVSTDSLTLVAQSTNLLVSNTDYYIEIDTSYLFNSNLKMSSVINSGSLIKWKDLELPYLTDSVVYYWRIRYNTIAFGEDTLWGESSFIHINGSPEGWSQSEFPQFFNDNLLHIHKNIPDRKWEFDKSETEIYVRTAGNAYIHTPTDPLFTEPWHETLIKLNGIVYELRGMCYPGGMFAVAFDKNTVIPYSPYKIEDGGFTCGITDVNKVNYFNALDDSTSLSKSGYPQNQSNLIDYIEKVKEGDYVLFGNSSDGYYQYWGTNLKNKLKTEFGAKFIDSLQPNFTYLLVGKKGSLTPIYEYYSDPTSLINYQDTLIGTYDKAYITSTLIGPAQTWGNFYRTVKKTEPSDSFNMRIIGVDIEGNNIDTFNIAQHDTVDLSTITNPYIRLLAEVRDTALLTAPQLKKWQVIYQGVPEGIMNTSLYDISQFNTVTKQEGDSISMCFAFENISNYDFADTLQVKYTITNSLKGPITNFVKLTPLNEDSIVTFCYKFGTAGLQGDNIFQAYVNPKILKEAYYNNNILEKSFTIEKDKIHPILDVAFDGTHIMDGDIVSPSPLITIILNDENKFLIRNTYTDIEIFLQKPADPIPQKIDLAGSDIVSAKQIGTNGKNIYQILYNPKNLIDGNYVLIVRGKDLSGNASGVLDYRIAFEVINESTISNFYPYPNPFSSSTRFVFTLTGNEIPQDLKIQIMTVTGKVVREITKAELGAIRIGNNKSDYAWDGTDEFGDKLANGVYLYRVILKNGGDFKHRNTAGDKAFKKNFGKLYILR